MSVLVNISDWIRDELKIMHIVDESSCAYEVHVTLNGNDNGGIFG